ncbi:MAG: ABC transporter ATP-binding protein/permease [Clostridiales bacterium]|nr:ABC transporter ATP-binding protein/permease [Clostridiales bacterium]
MPDNVKRPGDVEKFSGINRLFKSKAVQYIINIVDDGTFRDFFADWKWIFSFSKKYRWVIVFYTILGIISTSLSLLSSVISKYLVDIIVDRDTGMLWALIISMICSTVFSLVFSSLVSRYSTKLSIYVNNDIQAYIFDKIIDADWYELSKYANGDLLNRFNSDVSTIASNAVSWLPNVIIAVYYFVATFCVLFYYDHAMAFIALLSAPFLLLASRFIMRKNREYRMKVLQMNSSLMTFEAEAFYNFDTIKSFGVADHYSKGMRDWQEKYKKVNLDYNMFSIKTGIFNNLLGTLAYVVAFCYCLFALWAERITYGTMTLFLTQRSQLSSSFSSLVSIVPGMLNSAVSAHRVRELVELPREVHLAEESEAMAKAAEQGFEVRMTGVDFSYVEGEKVISGSDFVARPNEIVALVGPTGEGKTTLIRLILGLIHPGSGEVTLVDSQGNQVEINADTRRYFSYVPQGNTMISGTVAENLRMVKEDATDEEIVEALKIACAWDFVSKKEGGINGKLGERGKGFSGGQAQRIAIARAVLRDAPVLLLDEATSDLDIETERQVLRNIIRQRPNKTCIVTTHRPSVLSLCQRVYRVVDTHVTQLTEEESAKMVMDF